MRQVINLNKARKAKAKDDRRAKANANATRFGRSKSERRRDHIDRLTKARHHDGHKQEET